MTNIIFRYSDDDSESTDVSETQSPSAIISTTQFQRMGVISRMNCFGVSTSSSPLNNIIINGEVSNPPPNYVDKQYGEWPSWLSSAITDATKDWYPRRSRSFKKLEKVTEGSHSIVYKAIDASTGRTMALKKVRFQRFRPESVKSMVSEIQILRSLDHPNVIKLEDLVFIPDDSSNLYLVFEFMEHDLADLTIVQKIKLTEPQVKCYMSQLLSGLDHCHSRGVVHGNINESNLLIGEGGILKICGFGSASFSDSTLNPSKIIGVETVWYIAPEFLPASCDYDMRIWQQKKENCDMRLDLWSSGCVLDNLLALSSFELGLEDVPLVGTLLARYPVERQTAEAALRSKFFTEVPHACNPSSLPKCSHKNKMINDYIIKQSREFQYTD